MRSERKLGRQRLWTPFPSWRRPFSTSPPTVLDFAGENLPLSSYLDDALGVVSFLKALLGDPVSVVDLLPHG